jgi:hypothetical protein
VAVVISPISSTIRGLHAGAAAGYHAPTMLRDPQGRMLVLGVALAALANVLMTIPAVITGIPFAVPILAIVAVMGLALACRSGVAMARRRRERRPHG